MLRGKILEDPKSKDRLSLFHPSPHLSLFYHLKKYLVAAEEIGVLHAKIY